MDQDIVQEGAPIAGTSLAESNCRQQFDAIVIAVIDGDDDHMRFNPNARDTIHGNDTLIVLGSQDMMARLRDHGCKA